MLSANRVLLLPIWISSSPVICSVIFDSLQPHRLSPARLLFPWNSPGKNTGVGSHSLLKGIFLTQGLKCHLHCRQILCHLSHQGSPIWISFIYFSSLIAMARTSSKTILNNNSKNGHPCPVPDLRGNALFFSSENNICCGFVLYGLYYIEVGSFYAHFLKSFNHKWVLDFVKGFFYIY